MVFTFKGRGEGRLEVVEGKARGCEVVIWAIEGCVVRIPEGALQSEDSEETPASLEAVSAKASLFST